MSVMDASV